MSAGVKRDQGNADQRIDWDAFGRAVFSPARPSLAEATSVARELMDERRRSLRGRSKMSADALVEALTDPAVVRDVCETIATRLDDEWIFDGTRHFLPMTDIVNRIYSTKRLNRPMYTPRHVSDLPFEVELAVAIASGITAEIKTVEALAMEAAHAMIPWGATAPKRVAWMLIRDGWPAVTDRRWLGNRYGWTDIWNIPSRAVSRLRVRMNAPEFMSFDGLVRQIPPSVPGVADYMIPRRNALMSLTYPVGMWLAWNDAAERGAIITEDALDGADEEVLRRLVGKPLRDVQNPLDPYLRVWGLGYALMDVRGDTVVVGMPTAAITPMSASSWSSLQRVNNDRYGMMEDWTLQA